MHTCTHTHAHTHTHARTRHTLVALHALLIGLWALRLLDHDAQLEQKGQEAYSQLKEEVLSYKVGAQGGWQIFECVCICVCVCAFSDSM